MKKNQNKEMPKQDILDELLEGSALADAEEMDVTVNDSVCVIHKGKMTVLELTEVIDTLTNLASDLTVVLAQACGLCNNCGDGREDGENSGDAAAWMANCSLCHDLLDESQSVHIPDYLLEEAGIPADTKLEAYTDEDSGEITVVVADIQQDITDVPPGILAVLAQSGVCLAELDELIMRDSVIYGN